MSKLRGWFPLVQFIFTTHSPIEVLGASRDAVFYKLYKENDETKVSKPIENKSILHLMLNGIVTAPFLFELPSARQAAFDESRDSIDTSEDYLASKIREEVFRRVGKQEHLDEDEILKMIQEEFDKVEKELVTK